MEDISPWKQYHEETKDLPPRETLVAALPYVRERGVALDLGAGSLRDSRYLLKSGFQRVIALDSSPRIIDFVDEVHDDRLQAVNNSFEQFEFPPHTYDLINAQSSLPFTEPREFERVFAAMKASLKEGGIFVGNLFGPRDGWASNASMTFLIRQQVEELLSDMEVIELKETEHDSLLSSGEQKHWHTFEVTARKK